MLTNSFPWKEELRRSAERLEKKRTQKRWTDRSAYLVERDITVGAYAIRRLYESPGRLSDNAKALRVPIVSHSLTAPSPPDWGDAIDWWDYYDLDSGESKSVALRYFCNQLIHSFVFTFQSTEEEDGFAGVFVNSEYESRKSLTFIATETFVELFRAIGNDDVSVFGWRWEQGKRVPHAGRDLDYFRRP